VKIEDLGVATGLSHDRAKILELLKEAMGEDVKAQIVFRRGRGTFGEVKIDVAHARNLVRDVLEGIEARLRDMKVEV
jgi:hypothetical protein